MKARSGTGRRLGRRAAFAAGLTAVVIAAGCGGSSDTTTPTPASDQDAIRQVADEFVAGANARDWKKVCSLFTPDALAQAESLGVSCEQSFEQRNAPDEQITDYSVQSIHVNGDKATAVLKATNSAQGKVKSTQVFERVDGEWKMGLASSGGGSP